MKMHNFFPLSILQDQIEISDSEKNEMIKEIKKMKNDSQNYKYKMDDASWTGDTQGHEYIHNYSQFRNLFSQITEKIKIYLDTLKVDKNQIEIYLQRSWATISVGKEVISKHQHLQSHLSFAYYLKKTETDANLLFIDETKHNEFLPGLFLSPSSNKKQIIKKRNIANSGAIVFDAKEDEIVIFPSKTSHQTQPNIKNNNRISLSADIFITAKNTENMEHLVTPFKNWKIL